MSLYPQSGLQMTFYPISFPSLVRARSAPIRPGGGSAPRVGGILPARTGVVSLVVPRPLARFSPRDLTREEEKSRNLPTTGESGAQADVTVLSARSKN